MRVYVVYDSFKVVGGLLEFPEFLIDTGLVVECGDDDRPVDGLATARRIFQDFFVLVEVDECLAVVLVEHTGDAVRIEPVDAVHKLLCISQ